MASSDLSTIRKLQSSFTSLFHRHKDEFVFCRTCGERVEVGRFARHLSDEHALNCKTACPFCYTQVKWKKGDLSKDLFVASHRKTCFQTFLKTHEAPLVKEDHRAMCVPPLPPVLPPVSPLPPPAASVLPPPTTPWSTPRLESDGFCATCFHHHKYGVSRRLDGRTKHPERWGESFYAPFPNDALFFRHYGPKHVYFSRQSGLGRVAYPVFQCFLSKNYAFFHLMVHALLWRSFYDARSWPGVHFLPFSCLCDGTHTASEEEDDEGRVHHRHLLVAMAHDRVAAFKKTWNAIGLANKLRVRIRDESHLMYSVAYVSRRHASCNGYGNVVGGSGSHYWIFRELSPCSLLSLAALWPGGHAQLISKRHRESDLSVYYEHVEWIDGAWQVQLAHLGLKEQRCVLPFASNFALCDEWDEDRPEVYIYGRVRYLRWVPMFDFLPYDAWLWHQMQTGNCFWQGIGHQYYALEHYQKRCMNTVCKVVAKVKREYESAQTSRMGEMRQLEGQVVHYSELSTCLQRDVSALQSEVSTLRGDLSTSQKLVRTLEKRERELEKRDRQSQVRIRQLEASAERDVHPATAGDEERAGSRMEQLENGPDEMA